MAPVSFHAWQLSDAANTRLTPCMLLRFLNMIDDEDRRFFEQVKYMGLTKGVNAKYGVSSPSVLPSHIHDSVTHIVRNLCQG